MGLSDRWLLVTWTFPRRGSTASSSGSDDGSLTSSMRISLARLMSWGELMGRSYSRMALSAWNVLISMASPACRRWTGLGLPNTARLNGTSATFADPGSSGNGPAARTTDDSPSRNSSFVA